MNDQQLSDMTFESNGEDVLETVIQHLRKALNKKNNVKTPTPQLSTTHQSTTQHSDKNVKMTNKVQTTNRPLVDTTGHYDIPRGPPGNNTVTIFY